MKLESVDKLKNDKQKGVSLLWLLPLCLLVALGGLALKFYETEQPQVALLEDVARFGLAKRVVVAVTDAKSGVRSVEVLLRQGTRQTMLHRQGYQSTGALIASGPARVEENFVVDMSSLGFADGDAQLQVTARDFSWWHWRQGNATVVSFPVIIDTQPPRVLVTAAPTYIKTGSSGIVTYRVSEPVVRNGVMVNGDFHPGYPLPARGEQVYGATIAIRYDADKSMESYVTATDQAGNESRVPVGMIVRKSSQKADRINISDGFLNRKLPEFASHYPDLAGSPLEKYLTLNNRVRLENNKRIAEACSVSTPERFWDGAFLRLPRSSRKAGYADHRTYYFEGREIDHQVHLGVDLASTRHAKVTAANRGKVVLADYLGIYGNTVIIDHGQGVYSLYSHLSQIDVMPGDMVDKGGAVGLSGTSGMAGGDHLHFSMLVNGIFVNPVEWWDRHWVKVNLGSYL